MTVNQPLSAEDKPRITEVVCALCKKRASLDTKTDQATCSNDGSILTPEGTIFADCYLLLETLGSGGWGTVYKAEHIHLKKPLAIKVLHAHMARDRESLLRFQREARILSSISHPNMVAVSDHGWRPRPFIAMEYLEGKALSDVLAAGPLSPQRALPIFKQICQALSHAHEAGVIHRDLKPANIYLVGDINDPKVKVLDFGIAKMAETSLTATGATLGTITCMSPEQCLGQALDEGSDIYALGCLMYETLTGCVVFEGDSPLDIARKQIMQMPVPLLQANPSAKISVDLQQIVFTCLAKERDARFVTMSALETALDTANLTNTSAADKQRFFPLAWIGVLQAVIALPLLALYLGVNDNTALKESAWVTATASLFLTLALAGGIYWIWCVFALKSTIAKTGFKLRINPLCSALIVAVAPLAPFATSILEYVSIGVIPCWLSCTLLSTACFYLFLLPFMDFHSFLAERSGRGDIPFGRLLCACIAGMSLIPYILLYHLPPNSYSVLLRTVLAFAGWSMAFGFLQILINDLKVFTENSTVMSISQKRLKLAAGAIFILLLLTTGLLEQDVFGRVDSAIMAKQELPLSVVVKRTDKGITVQISDKASLQNEIRETIRNADEEGHAKQLPQFETICDKTGHNNYDLEERLGWSYLMNHRYTEAFNTLSAASDIDDHGDQPYCYLGAFIGASLNKEEEKAMSMLNRCISNIGNGWPRPVALFLAGRLTRAEMFARVSKEQDMTEAHFYSAIDYWRKKNFALANQELEWVIKNGDHRYLEYEVADALTEKGAVSGNVQ